MVTEHVVFIITSKCLVKKIRVVKEPTSRMARCNKYARQVMSFWFCGVSGHPVSGLLQIAYAIIRIMTQLNR